MENISTNVTPEEAEVKEEEVREAIKISVDPIPFNPVADIKVTTTLELSKLINDIFFQVFSDYYGCNIECQFMANRGFIIVPRLYFRVLNPKEYKEDCYYAFKPLSAQNASNLFERVQKISQMSGSAAGANTVTMTDDIKATLEDFVISPANNDMKKFDWNSSFTVSSSNADTFVRVFKLDIIKFIKKLYGDKDETGKPYYYQIAPTQPVGAPNQYKEGTNWAVNILRLSERNQNYAAELLGWGPQGQFGSSIVTTTTKSNQ